MIFIKSWIIKKIMKKLIFLKISINFQYEFLKIIVMKSFLNTKKINNEDNLVKTCR